MCVASLKPSSPAPPPPDPQVEAAKKKLRQISKDNEWLNKCKGVFSEPVVAQVGVL